MCLDASHQHLPNPGNHEEFQAAGERLQRAVLSPLKVATLQAKASAICRCWDSGKLSEMRIPQCRKHS